MVPRFPRFPIAQIQPQGLAAALPAPEPKPKAKSR